MSHMIHRSGHVTTICFVALLLASLPSQVAWCDEEELGFDVKSLDEAIEYYAIAIKIKPDWSPPYYRQGLVYLNKTNYAKAQQNFEKFLEIDPNSELAGQVRSMLDYLEKIKK